MSANPNSLKDLIEHTQDFPAPGVIFRDITPILKSPKNLQDLVEQMCALLDGVEFDAFAGIESRGFILASAMALHMGKGFIPIRKAGKLPPPTKKIRYHLEYGQASLEMKAGNEKIILIDDVLATGGTLGASIELATICQYTVVDVAVMIDLTYLNKFLFNKKTVKSLIQY